MKNLFAYKRFVFLLFFIQFVIIAQENKIKIYESKLGDGRCLIVFPCSPEPLMIITGDGACKTTKIMATDDWMEMPSSTLVTTTPIDVNVPSNLESSRDAASGLATGKRQHKPFQLKDLTIDKFESDGSQVYSFSWEMKNTFLSRNKSNPTYDLKKNEKARTVTNSIPENSCCSNGMCTVTVAVSNKHTKTGHVTLIK